jgi:hypothetical protein
MTRAAFLTSLKVTLIYAAGFLLCQYVLAELPAGFHVLIAVAYFSGAMFWVFRITKHQLAQMAALRTELRASDESFESRVRSRTVELEQILEKNKSFQGIIPICANCKSIRNGTGDWERIESFIQHHSEAVFSHGLCPKCNEALYGDQRRRLEHRLEGKASEKT